MCWIYSVAAVFRARNYVICGVPFAGEEDATIQKALGFVRGPNFGDWACKIRALQAKDFSLGLVGFVGSKRRSTRMIPSLGNMTRLVGMQDVGAFFD